MFRKRLNKKCQITIVSGLPRSGTSMMMKAIHAGGIGPMIDNIRKADEDNPKGYYEFEPVKKTKEDPSWLKDAAGKVVKMVYRLLYDLPANHEYRVVFMQRDLKEVIASQNKMLRRSGKDGSGVTDDQMSTLFTAELEKCDKWLAAQSNFKVLYVNHRDMINEALVQVKRVDDFLGGGLDIEAMAGTVDSTLYRNRNP
ncbi:MAG: sulfotransferase domain-containing protein [Planctomycetota bacterium]